MAGDDDDEPPQGVIVCVRVRPLFLTRPDGSPAREFGCKRVVEMEGVSDACGSAVTKIYNPEDMEEEPRVYAFDRSYWSCDGYKDDPERPGFFIPDGPDSKYVCQDMVWKDVGQIMMKNILNGYSCTVFAYGQSGSGKSYSVVGYNPNLGIIPNTVTNLFAAVDGNKDPDVRFKVEIAMLEIYMDEVYDLLEPRKKERTKLSVFRINGKVLIYDKKDRKNKDKIWRAARDKAQCDSFRSLGDKNRSVRATGMNPTSSRGHTLFIIRFRKEKRSGDSWVEQFRSKITLVDLAGSERAHDTGLKGIGLEEGIAINTSLSCLGQTLVQICKGGKVSYRDKLTRCLSESLGGEAITIMIAALSPANINYNDTVSTLRFADNAKKMPVKPTKQLDPTAALIAKLQEENARLQAQLTSMGNGVGGGGGNAEEEERERKEWEAKLAAADKKVADSQKAMEEMEVQIKQNARLHMAALSTAQEEAAKMKEALAEKAAECEAAKAARAQKAEEMQAEIAELNAKLKGLAASGGEDATSQEKSELEALLQSKLAESQQAMAEMEKRVKENERKHLEALAAAQEEATKLKKQMEDNAAALQAAKTQRVQKMELTNEEIAKLRTNMEQLAAGGGEEAASQEKSRLEELLQRQVAEEATEKEMEAKEKVAHEELMEASFAEIEHLQDERNGVRTALLRAKTDALPEAAQLEGRLAEIEEKLRASRKACEALYDQAVVLGVGESFRAASLAISRQEKDAQMLFIQQKIVAMQSGAHSAEDMQSLENELAAATEAAKATTEEARLAAAKALEEKMASLDAISLERDEAMTGAENARERLGAGEAELREQMAAIQDALESEQESWEAKLQAADEAQQRLNESFADMGLSVMEMLNAASPEMRTKFYLDGGMPPHFINLCEDAHEHGLVYLIPDGVTRVKEYDPDDQELGIKLKGSTIRPHHATLISDGEKNRVTIHSGQEGAVIWINGERLNFGSTVVLKHGDRVVFGGEFCFRFVDPRHKKVTTEPGKGASPGIVDWQYAVEELWGKSGGATAAEKDKLEKELAAAQKQSQELEKKLQAAEAELKNKSSVCTLL